jgi:hypothetical protein
MITIRPAVVSDIQRAMKQHSAVSESYLKASLFSWTGLVDDEVACVWGLLAPTMLSDSAYLWLITSPVIEEHKFTFVRHSQMIVKAMLEDFPSIKGHVLANQPNSRRWLQWLGVCFQPPITGYDGISHLIPFELRRAISG